MSYGRTADRRREAAKKHLLRLHRCRCGRIIRGNAYHLHKRRCQAVLDAAHELVKDKL